MKFGRMERIVFNEATDGTEGSSGGFDFELLQQKAEEAEERELSEEEESTEEPKEEETPTEPTEESTTGEGEPAPEATEKDSEEVEQPKEEVEQPKEEVVVSEDGDPESKTYEPDLSFKALDQDHQMPEWLKDSIKSKEQEDQLREIFQKAEGLGHIKSKNEHLKSQIEQIKPQYEEQSNTLNYLDHLVENKDIDNIQKMARLSDEDILNHAAKILQRQELTPEQQQAYNNEVEKRNSQYFTQQENATLRDTQYQQYVQSQEQLLDQTLLSDSVKPYVDFYNNKVGDQAKFKKDVIDYAAKIQNQTSGQTILTVEQAVEGFLQERVKPFFQEPSTEENPTEEVPATEQQPPVEEAPPADPREKPVMPQVRGGASKSPAKPVFKSIADIEAYRDKYFDTE